MSASHHRRFVRDQSGAISVIAALSVMMMMAIAAIVIDTGSLYFARRTLQSTSDAAALAAVQNPTDAAAIVASVFASNGYSSPALSVTTGIYTADESLSADARFATANSGANAVRVRATVQQPTFFAGLFGLANHSPLTTQAVAARVPTASFGAGTRLAELNNGLINRVLGELWGSSLSLSLLDYQSLLSTNIDALAFLNQLATDIHVTGSYQELASADVTTGQILNALVEAGATAGALNGDSTGALMALQRLQLQVAGAPQKQFSNVVDLSPLAARTIGGIAPDIGQGLQFNLMDLLSADARSVASGQTTDIGTTLNIPVTNSSVSTRLSFGNQMAQAAIARVGTTINTAQIRIALTVKVTSVNLGVATASVQVPIFLQAAPGQATLTDMPCIAGGILTKISATSGATTLQYGTVNDAALKDFSASVTPVSTPIVSFSLLGIPIQVDIGGTNTVAASGPEPLTFNQAEIDAGTVKSVPNGGNTPFAALSTGTTFSASILANPGILGDLLNSQLSTLTAALQPVVANLLNQLDTPVNSVMTALGLQLGSIGVRDFDASCRTPTLVG